MNNGSAHLFNDADHVGTGSSVKHSPAATVLVTESSGHRVHEAARATLYVLAGHVSGRPPVMPAGQYVPTVHVDGVVDGESGVQK